MFLVLALLYMFLMLKAQLSQFRRLSILILMLILCSCTIARMDMVGGIQTSNSVGGIGGGPRLASEVFTAGQAQRKVDVLFIDDNSSSMDAMQSSLGDRFSTFSAAMSGIDWTAGITTTDCSTGPYGICGTLLTMAGTGSNVLLPTTPSLSTVFRNTIVRPETVGCLVRADCPSGDSTPLRSLLTAMQKSTTVNVGFFRPDATLAVVMLTNADENNVAPTPSSITPANVIDQFQALWGAAKPFTVYTIAVLQGDSSCLTQQQAGGLATYGTYPISLAQMTGGFSQSICSPNYTPVLQAIGDDLQGTPNVVRLAHVPRAGSLVVTLTPASSIGWSLNGDTITFNSVLPVGTIISTTYEY